jgi:hypothetical protein
MSTGEDLRSAIDPYIYVRSRVWRLIQWRIFTFCRGRQSLLNFCQNFQISDNPPPFALEKTVFSPLLGQNFRKFVNSATPTPPRPTKISATGRIHLVARLCTLSNSVLLLYCDGDQTYAA